MTRAPITSRVAAMSTARPIWLCLSAGACLALLTLTGVAQAPSSEPATGIPSVSWNAEPITPIPLSPAADPGKLALGEQLFADSRLSHDQTRSCMSCHDIRTNGADHERLGVGPQGQPLSFNTPTIFNAALSFRLDWDGKHRTLEEQAEASLLSPRVMATSMKEVLARLNADPRVKAGFQEAYGRGPDRTNVLDAIATYERSLVTPGGRFDRWLAGDASALSAAEINGYREFKSLGCISCHQGVNIGGNLFEHRGIFGSLGPRKPDLLRVPSLRNVAITSPYFHDGGTPTLEDAVRKMGLAQLGQKLADPQVAAIVTFLNTLTASPAPETAEARQ